MVIFHSYVKLPEGIWRFKHETSEHQPSRRVCIKKLGFDLKHCGLTQWDILKTEFRKSFNGYGVLSIPVLDSSKVCMPIIRGDLHFVFEIETRVELGGFSSETYGLNCNSSFWSEVAS